MSKNLFSLQLIILVLGVMLWSCNKDDDGPHPVEKKKYAWVCGPQDSTGYAMILFSPDAGDTWERQGLEQQALEGIDLQDIWAIDENTVLACGSGNSILRTTNGGEHWSRLALPADLPGADLLSIGVTNKTNVWVGGGFNDARDGLLYRSADRGDSWELIDTTFFRDYFVQGVFALTHDRVYVAGTHYEEDEAKGYIGYTINGGVTWDTVKPADGFDKWQWIGVVSRENTIVVYGAKSRYMVSTDGGITWANDSVPSGGTNGADINDLIMLDEQTWWGAFDMGQIYMTTDGGSSWDAQQTPGLGGNFMVGIDSWDEQLALSVPFSNVWPAVCPIVQTKDGGQTWVTRHTCYSSLNKVTFIRE